MQRTAILAILLVTLVVAACGTAAPVQQDLHEASYNLGPASALPAEVRQAPAGVQEAYRFALANREVLSKIPCYCGCGSVGHMDNWMCYLRPEGTTDQPVFDYHAVG
jgi:predicted small secreted protein